MVEKNITVRAAATQLGVTARTLKYYEELGIVVPVRSKSRYRMYEMADLDKLARAFRLRSLGFSLTAIASMLNHSSEVPNEGGRPRMSKSSLQSLRALLASQLETIDTRIGEVTRELKEATELRTELQRDFDYVEHRLAGEPIEAALRRLKGK
jgi:DNA-binding transcriptional MerR regulator